MNYYTYVMLVGVGHAFTASVFPYSTLTPRALITWPRNSTYSKNNAHFDSLINNLFY